MTKRKVARFRNARQASLQDFVDGILRENRYLESVAEAYFKMQIMSNEAVAALITDVLEGRMHAESLKKFKQDLERSTAKMQAELDSNGSMETDVGIKPGNTAFAGRGSIGRYPADDPSDQQHEKPAGELREVQGSARNLIHAAHETRNFF